MIKNRLFITLKILADFTLWLFLKIRYCYNTLIVQTCIAIFILLKSTHIKISLKNDYNFIKPCIFLIEVNNFKKLRVYKRELKEVELIYVPLNLKNLNQFLK